MWLAPVTLQQFEPQPAFLPSFCVTLIAKLAQGIEVLANLVRMTVVNLKDGRSFHRQFSYLGK